VEKQVNVLKTTQLKTLPTPGGVGNVLEEEKRNKKLYPFNSLPDECYQLLKIG
jgi:hypothetical protein